MLKKINDLSIGQSIFLLLMVFVSTIVLLSGILTYRLIFVRTDDLIESTSKEINKQVVLNYESYLSNVIDTSNSLQKYIVDYTKQNNYNQLSELFTNSVAISNNIVNIALFNQQGNVLSASQQEGLISNYSNFEWFAQATSNPDIHHFSKPHIQDLTHLTNQQVFSVTKSVEIINDNQSSLGVLLIDINTDEFIQLSNQTNLGDQGHIVILDANNEYIYDSLNECVNQNCLSIGIIQDIILGGQLQTINNTSMYVNVNTITHTRWKMATFINVNEITQAKNQMFINMALIFISMIFILAIVSFFFAKRINDPMNTLKRYIKKIEKGDFDSHVYVSGQKEVVALADAFNTMSDRIKMLMSRVLIEQKEKRKTHFKALQNQINPHFLYNTLDSIVWLSENNRNADVEKAIIALSKFFRMSISSESNIVPLQDEIEHVSNYLLIQQIRYQNSFDFTINIDQDVLQHKVLKLSLQPLVENAIIHGIKPDESFNEIKISAYKDEHFLYIEVFNQGYGIDQSKIAEIMHMLHVEKESTSMGLKNVYQRLKLYYGPSADLLIESEMDEYTKVIMKIPVHQKELP